MWSILCILVAVMGTSEGFSHGWSGSRSLRKSFSVMSAVPFLKRCSVFVKDLPKSSKFYSEVVGLPAPNSQPVSGADTKSQCFRMSNEFDLVLNSCPPVDSMRKFSLGQGFHGIGIARPEAETNTIWQRLEASKTPVHLPFEDYFHGASETPDEDEMLQTHVRYAVFTDPSGYQLELRDSSYVSEVFENFASPEAAANYQHGDRVSLYVEDMNDSVEFYTSLVGLAFLRRRAEVNSGPPQAATTAYVGNVADGGKPKVFLELKYMYASDKINHGTNPLELTIAVPNVEEVVKRIRAKEQSVQKKEDEDEDDKKDVNPNTLEAMVRHEDGSVTVKDPSGHNVKLVKIKK